MSIYGCSFTSEDLKENTNRLNESINLWNSLEGIQEIHGRASIANHTFGGSFRDINDLFQSRVDSLKNLHPDYILGDKVYKRLNEEIKLYNNRITRKGYVNPLENIIGVPHEVVKRSPLSYRMYRGVDEQVSYERTNLGHLREFTSGVSGNLLQAFKDAAAKGNMGREGVDALKKLQILESAIAKSESKAVRAQYELSINELLEIDKEINPQTNEISSGRMLNMFREGIEMTNSEWGKAKKEYSDISPSLIKAVEGSKKYFNKMSGVLMNGMRTLQDNVLIKKHGTSDIKSSLIKSDKQTMKFVENIGNTISSIKAKRDEGSYYPHYILKDLPQLKEAVDGVSSLGRQKGWNEAFDNIGNILSDMQNPISRRSMKRGSLEYTFLKDPIMVGQMYGYDVVGFNKQNHLQKLFTDFTRSLPKDRNVSAEFISGMARYMDDIYTMSTKGYADRPDWVNSALHTIGSATAIRTMGLGFTGSLRNLASAATYYAHFGRKSLKTASHLYETDTERITDTDGRVTYEGIGSIARRAEQENGFLFAEGNIDVANELFTFGLLPEKGVNEKSIKFDHMTGNITYEQNGVSRTLKEAADWTVNKSLVFHRITENWMRRWMFRTAFINKYLSDTSQPEYVRGKGSGRESAGKRAIERESINFAINAVNSWAYEYAGHAKSKWIRGVPGQVNENGVLTNAGKVYMGAASQTMNMLTHYPHSLVATHIRQLRGAGLSVKVGDWMSPEMMWAYRYGGIYLGIQLGSVLLNTDLNNIAENDSIEKIKEAVKSMVHYDNSDKITRGVLGQLFGPMPDDLRYIAEVTGLKSADRSDIEKIILGNQNYGDQYGDEAAKALWYKIGTTPGLVATKLYPSLMDGKGWDALRHLFKAYPTRETRAANEVVMQDFLQDFAGLPDGSGLSPDSLSPSEELLYVSELAKKKNQRTYGRRA